jgi:hypothetical protein
MLFKLALFLILIGLSTSLVIFTYMWLTLVEGLRSSLQAHTKAATSHGGAA